MNSMHIINGLLFESAMFEALHTAQQLCGYKNVNVGRNVRLLGMSGRIREFDLYWEYILNGQLNRCVIDCKTFSRGAMSRLAVERFSSILSDYNGICGILAVKGLIQDGVVDFARTSNISIVRVRTSLSGDSAQLPLTVHYEVPPMVEKFIPLWQEGNHLAEERRRMLAMCSAEELKVGDLEHGFKSLQEIATERFYHSAQHGINRRHLIVKNEKCILSTRFGDVPLDGYRIYCVRSSNVAMHTSVSPEVFALLEFLFGGREDSLSGNAR